MATVGEARRSSTTSLPRELSAGRRILSYVSLVTVVCAFGAGLASRSLLPSRYFNDDARIQLFIQYPELVTRDGSYRGTADLYRFLHLGNHQSLTAGLGMAAFGLTLLLAWRLAGHFGRPDVESSLVVIVGMAWSVLYFAHYSKEMFVLPIVALLLLSTRSRVARVAFVTITFLYALDVRSYWFAVLAVYLLSMRFRQLLTNSWRVAAAYGTLVAVFSAVFASGIIGQLNYTRTNILAHLSFDPTTAIHPPFGDGSALVNSASTLYIFVTLLLPFTLAFFGPLYLITGVILGTIWVRAIRMLPGLIRTGDARGDLVLFALSYVTVLSLFEPDYGSYVRHFTPVLPVFVVVFARARTKFASVYDNTCEELGHV